MRKTTLALLVLACLFTSAFAVRFPGDGKVHSFRTDSTGLFDVSPVPSKPRLHLIGYTVAAAYPGSMVWLYSQWYRDYPQSSFHFFNDNGEWQQMDKFAHLWDAYSVSKPLMKLFYWSGLTEKKSALYGTGIAYLFQTTIEVFDGFSSEWGFSWGDAMANTIGAGTILSQQLLWDEQRITLKYSFHQTKYAKYRPAVLGSNVIEGILKDYNGLTCWVSINPYSFMNKSSAFPRWLSLGIGFGAEGMTGGYTNPAEVDGKPIPHFDRYRQYYLAVDFDLARIKTRSKFLSGFFKVINIIHLPSPAIEFNEGRSTVFRALYF
jgi:hypothetical protein